jgi:hypothetical protein
MRMSPTHCDTVFSPSQKNSQEKAPRMLVANWGQRIVRTIFIVMSLLYSQTKRTTRVLFANLVKDYTCASVRTLTASSGRRIPAPATAVNTTSVLRLAALRCSSIEIPPRCARPNA